MPPCAAPEWLRTGCIFETTATSGIFPSAISRSAASTAARIPARPPPMTMTSCLIKLVLLPAERNYRSLYEEGQVYYMTLVARMFLQVVLSRTQAKRFRHFSVARSPSVHESMAGKCLNGSLDSAGRPAGGGYSFCANLVALCYRPSLIMRLPEIPLFISMFTASIPSWTERVASIRFVADARMTESPASL